MFRLTPCNLPLPPTARRVLEGSYPPGFLPLDRSKTLADLHAELARAPGAETLRGASLRTGLQLVEAGPIHAGIKEAAAIEICIGGESIETLEVYPGRKHRGVEKQFETMPLEDGWRLVEVVDGQTGVAHALAYCLAVESIANVEPPSPAQAWRAALLELERIANHIGSCATLVHDIKMSTVSSPMFTLRERIRDLNERLTGNRWLRGVIRPGGVLFEPGLVGDRLMAELGPVVDRFLALAIAVLQSPSCRDRLIGGVA